MEQIGVVAPTENIVPETVNAKKSKIVRLCNLSGSVTEKMARQLLENISPLEEFVMYPKDKSIPTATKVAYARFKDPEAYKCAIHLTSSLLLDRPLIVVPMSSYEIPSEVSAINTATQLSAEEVSQLVVGGALVGSGINIALNFGFPYVPTPPELPSDYSSRRQSEVRRTIFVNNIHPDVTAEVLLTLFSGVGEVRYIRLFDDKNSSYKCAFIEFTESTTVYPALQFHEFPLFDLPIGVTFAITSINKDSQSSVVSSKSKHSRSPSRKSYKSPTRRSPSRSRRSPSHKKRSRSREAVRKHRRDSNSRERHSKSRRSRSPNLERGHKRRSRSRDDEYYESKRAKKRRRTSSVSSDKDAERKSRKKLKSGKSSSRKKSRSSSVDNSSKRSKRHSSHKDDTTRKRESNDKHDRSVNSPSIDWSEEERLYLESKKNDPYLTDISQQRTTPSPDGARSECRGCGTNSGLN